MKIDNENLTKQHNLMWDPRKVSNKLWNWVMSNENSKTKQVLKDSRKNQVGKGAKNRKIIYTFAIHTCIPKGL